jgi:hypothetical protein
MNVKSLSARKYYFWVGATLILLFTFLEPAGTEDKLGIERFLIWTIQIALLLPLLIGIHIGLQSIHFFDRLNPWLKLAFSGLLGSFFFMPIALAIDYQFQLDERLDPGHWRALIPVLREEFSGIVWPVTLTWVAINAPRILQISFQDIEAPVSGDPTAQHEQATSEALNGFWSLIPREIGKDIIYLKSELHYVRVVTTGGEKLVLFNLKDAVADLEKRLPGIQTHRSYWVSGNHIKAMVSEKNRPFILTRNDQKVPVSRRKTAAARRFMKTLA